MKYLTSSYLQKCIFFSNLRWFISVIIYTAQEHTEEEGMYVCMYVCILRRG